MDGAATAPPAGVAPIVAVEEAAAAPADTPPTAAPPVSIEVPPVAEPADGGGGGVSAAAAPARRSTRRATRGGGAATPSVRRSQRVPPPPPPTLLGSWLRRIKAAGAAVRAGAAGVASHWAWNAVVAAAVVLGCAAIIATDRFAPKCSAAWPSAVCSIDVVVVVVFAVEAGLKLVADGVPAYASSGWDVLDGIVLACNAAALSSTIPPIRLTGLRLLRVLKIGASSRWRAVAGSAAMVSAMRTGARYLCSVFTLCAAVFLCFAIIGITLFGASLRRQCAWPDGTVYSPPPPEPPAFCNPDTRYKGGLRCSDIDPALTCIDTGANPDLSHFDNLGNAMWTVVLIAFGGEWSTLVYNLSDAENPWVLVYVLAVIIVCMFLMLNMLTSAICDAAASAWVDFNTAAAERRTPPAAVPAPHDAFPVDGDGSTPWWWCGRPGVWWEWLTAAAVIANLGVLTTYTVDDLLAPAAGSASSSIVGLQHLSRGARIGYLFADYLFAAQVVVDVVRMAVNPATRRSWALVLDAGVAITAIVALPACTDTFTAAMAPPTPPLHPDTLGWLRTGLLLRVASLLRLLHLMRLPPIATALGTMIQTSTGAVASILVMTAVLCLAFGLLGKELYGGVIVGTPLWMQYHLGSANMEYGVWNGSAVENALEAAAALPDPRLNCDTFPSCMSTLFVISTGESWELPMYNFLTAPAYASWAAPVLVVGWYMAVALVVLSLVVAAILDQLSVEDEVRAAAQQRVFEAAWGAEVARRENMAESATSSPALHPLLLAGALPPTGSGAVPQRGVFHRVHFSFDCAANIIRVSVRSPDMANLASSGSSSMIPSPAASPVVPPSPATSPVVPPSPPPSIHAPPARGGSSSPVPATHEGAAAPAPATPPPPPTLPPLSLHLSAGSSNDAGAPAGTGRQLPVPPPSPLQRRLLRQLPGWLHPCIHSRQHARAAAWWQSDVSCGCLTPRNAARRWLRSVASSWVFAWASTAVTVGASVALAFQTRVAMAASEPWIGATNVAFTILFAAELAVNLAAYGAAGAPRAYLRNGWHQFDALIVAASVLEVCVEAPFAVEWQTGAWYHFFRLGRILRPLRLLQRFTATRQFVHAVASGATDICAGLALVLAVFVIIALFAVNLLTGRLGVCSDASVPTRTACRGVYATAAGDLEVRFWVSDDPQFDTLPRALSALLEASTLTNFLPALWRSIDVPPRGGPLAGRDVGPMHSASPANLLLYLAFIVAVSYILIKIFVGVIVVHVSRARGTAGMTSLQRQWAAMAGQIALSVPAGEESTRRRLHRTAVAAWVRLLRASDEGAAARIAPSAAPVPSLPFGLPRALLHLRLPTALRRRPPPPPPRHATGDVPQVAATVAIDAQIADVLAAARHAAAGSRARGRVASRRRADEDAMHTVYAHYFLDEDDVGMTTALSSGRAAVASMGVRLGVKLEDVLAAFNAPSGWYLAAAQWLRQVALLANFIARAAAGPPPPPPRAPATATRAVATAGAGLEERLTPVAPPSGAAAGVVPTTTGQSPVTCVRTAHHCRRACLLSAHCRYRACSLRCGAVAILCYRAAWAMPAQAAARRVRRCCCCAASACTRGGSCSAVRAFGAAWAGRLRVARALVADLVQPCMASEAVCAARGHHFHAIHSRFERGILVLVFLNVVLLAMTHDPMSAAWQSALAVLNYAFLVAYTVEAALRLVASGPVAYFRNGWNAIDFAVVAASWPVTVVAASPGGLQAARALRLLRASRILRKAPALRLMFSTMMAAFRPVLSVAAVFCLLLFVGALAGVDLYGGVGNLSANGWTAPLPPVALQFNLTADLPPDDPAVVAAAAWAAANTPLAAISRHANFRTVPAAMLTLLRVVVVDNWPDIYHDCWRLSRWAPLYYTLIVLVLLFLAANLFLAVVYDHFENVLQLELGDVSTSDVTRFATSWAAVDVNGTGTIPMSAVFSLLLRYSRAGVWVKASALTPAAATVSDGAAVTGDGIYDEEGVAEEVDDGAGEGGGTPGETPGAAAAATTAASERPSNNGSGGCRAACSRSCSGCAGAAYRGGAALWRLTCSRGQLRHLTRGWAKRDAAGRSPFQAFVAQSVLSQRRWAVLETELAVIGRHTWMQRYMLQHQLEHAFYPCATCSAADAPASCDAPAAPVAGVPRGAAPYTSAAGGGDHRPASPVSAVLNEVEVDTPPSHIRDDAIAAVARVPLSNLPIPYSKLLVTLCQWFLGDAALTVPQRLRRQMRLEPILSHALLSRAQRALRAWLARRRRRASPVAAAAEAKDAADDVAGTGGAAVDASAAGVGPLAADDDGAVGVTEVPSPDGGAPPSPEAGDDAPDLPAGENTSAPHAAWE